MAETHIHRLDNPDEIEKATKALALAKDQELEAFKIQPMCKVIIHSPVAEMILSVKRAKELGYNNYKVLTYEQYKNQDM